MLDVSIARSTLPTSGAVLLPIDEGGAAKAVARAGLDKATGGAVARALEAAEFKGKKGQTVTILAPGGGISRVVAVGLGKLDELTLLGAEEAGGNGVAQLAREPAVAVLAADGLTAAQAAHLALGAVLRAYRFDRYRTTEKPDEKPRLAALKLLVADPAATEKAWAPLPAVAEGVFLTRDLVSEPANVLTPPEFARRIEGLTRLGLKIEVFGPKEMAKLGFGALLGVAQGSEQEPRMVVIEWHGAGAGEGGGGGKGKKKAPAAKAKPLAFIGKGVTFDSGGISIKPAAGMEEMKWDMAGAGTVVGLMATLAGRKAKVDAVGLVGLVENMPSGTAQRPGDVVKTYSGQTVEIINTDAEGRMVLADVLWYCQEKFEPRFMVDLATLTGAMVVALGHEIGGFFSNDDALAQQLHAAGEATGEKLWRMPLGEGYDKQIKSDIADMKHVGGRPGGAVTAAQFLQRFVNGKPWAHLDIAGMAWSSKDAATVPKGATAYGVRLLDRLVASNFET
jgi:leucyl aminopeptidase